MFACDVAICHDNMFSFKGFLHEHRNTYSLEMRRSIIYISDIFILLMLVI